MYDLVRNLLFASLNDMLLTSTLSSSNNLSVYCVTQINVDVSAASLVWHIYFVLWHQKHKEKLAPGHSFPICLSFSCTTCHRAIKFIDRANVFCTSLLDNDSEKERKERRPSSWMFSLKSVIGSRWINPVNNQTSSVFLFFSPHVKPTKLQLTLLDLTCQKGLEVIC